MRWGLGVNKVVVIRTPLGTLHSTWCLWKSSFYFFIIKLTTHPLYPTVETNCIHLYFRAHICIYTRFQRQLIPSPETITPLIYFANWTSRQIKHDFEMRVCGWGKLRREGQQIVVRINKSCIRIVGCLTRLKLGFSPLSSRFFFLSG